MVGGGEVDDIDFLDIATDSVNDPIVSKRTTALTTLRDGAVKRWEGERGKISSRKDETWFSCSGWRTGRRGADLPRELARFTTLPSNIDERAHQCHQCLFEPSLESS
jgi:hypothetical protein